MMKTLNAACDEAASITHRGFTFLDDNLSQTHWSFAEVCNEAKKVGSSLKSIGLAKGDRLALVLSEPEDFVPYFLGAISIGVMPVPMYPPLALGRLDSYIERAVGILRVSGARFLATTNEFLGILRPVLGRAPGIRGLIDIEMLRQNRVVANAGNIDTKPDEPCFLQFTSGSTSSPRGVVVTHGNLIANAEAIVERLECNPDRDLAVSWLPLYHDMGLIGFVIASLIAKVSVVFIPTIAFVKHPGVWMETVHKYRATVTFGPNFAFELAAKRAPRNSKVSLDLSCIRVLGCGAEPINPRTVENFLAAFVPYGLSPTSLMPCYGMAEATLAIAFEGLYRPMRKLVIDRHAYESRNVAQPMDNRMCRQSLSNIFELVSCGRTFPGHEIRIVNERGQPLPEGHVGEIVFHGPSVTPGYFRNARASRRLIRHGWLHTGDVGFVLDGDLFISGRQKDLVIINGRNYPPQAIEWVVEEIAGIRKGSVVAFSVNGNATEKLVVIAETTMMDNPELSQTVRDQIRSALALTVDTVVLVGRGSIPKTSSGKLQRRRAKALFEAGLLGSQSDRLNSTKSTGSLAS